MKLLLICAGGLSTGILVKSIVAYAKTMNDQDFVCDAVSFAKFGELHNEYDVTFYGPQIRNQKLAVFDKCEEGYPLEPIDLKDYGTMNGENIYKKAMAIYLSKNTVR